MQRVLIVGSGGAGKSTLARQLGECTGLPVVHLDVHFWQAGWQSVSRETFDAFLAQALAEGRWIMDGNYDRTLTWRLERADTLIFLDLSRWICLYRIFARVWRYRGRTRPDLAPGCPEQVDRAFTRWVWRYPIDVRPQMLEHLEAARTAGKTVVHLRTRREVAAWVREMEKRGN